MATFPTLTPSSRTFTPGRHPHSEIPTLNGLQVRVMASNVILEQQLRLTFVGLTEAEMLSIRSHYMGQQGRFLSFDIPSDLLSGTTTPSSFTPTGYSWIYASRPTVTDIGLQRYDVSVELATVPPEGANINGSEFTVNTSFVGGTYSVSAGTSGTDLAVTVSLEAAIATGAAEATGATLTVVVTIAGGVATGGAPPPTISFIGTATALSPTQSANAPTHQVGDLLVVISSVLTSRPFPALSGFTTLFTLADGNQGGTVRVQYRSAASTSYTIATWGGDNFTSDNATILVYRNASIGASATNTISPRDYPALTFNVTDNSSWGLKILAAGAAEGFNTPATGFTMRRQQYFTVISDSNTGVSSQAAETVSGGSATTLGATIELVATSP